MSSSISPPPVASSSPVSVGATPRTKEPVSARGNNKKNDNKGDKGKEKDKDAEKKAQEEKEQEQHKKHHDTSYLQKIYQEEREKERIANLESAHHSLQHTVSMLRSSLDTSEIHRAQNVAHLQRSWADSKQEVIKLQEKVKSLEEGLEKERESYKKEKELNQVKHVSEIEILEERMKEIQKAYDDLKSFKEKQSSLEEEIRNVYAQLEQEKVDHANNVCELERRNVLEKDRLKNEMLRKIRETKLALLAMTEDQLHTTTKRTIMENEQMTTELQYQSKETERILARNSALLAENASLKKEVELGQQTQKMMAKKTMFYQNLITKLQSKIDDHMKLKEKLKHERNINVPYNINLPSTSSHHQSSSSSPTREKDSSLSLTRLVEREKLYEKERKNYENLIFTLKQEKMMLNDRIGELEKEVFDLRNHVNNDSPSLTPSTLNLHSSALHFISSCIEDSIADIVGEKIKDNYRHEEEENALASLGGERNKIITAQKNNQNNNHTNNSSSNNNSNSNSTQNFIPWSSFDASTLSADERNAVLRALFKQLNEFSRTHEKIMGKGLAVDMNASPSDNERYSKNKSGSQHVGFNIDAQHSHHSKPEESNRRSKGMFPAL